jgi:hypothetical protein
VRLVATTALLALTASCASLPYEREGPGFVVRATDDRLGECVAGTVPELLLRIPAVAPAERPSRLVLLVRGGRPGTSHGRSYSDRIELEIDPGLPEAGPAELRHLLAHEMAHSLLPAGWHRLPAVVEEGVAETVADVVAPLPGGGRPRAGLDPDALSALLELSRDDVEGLTPEGRRGLTAVGRAIVGRIGPPRLQVLVERSGSGRAMLEQVLEELRQAPPEPLSTGAFPSREARGG